MPHYIGLIRMLFAAPDRVSATGSIHLSAAEAEYVRALDFPTAAEGDWPLPEWPDYVLHVYPELGRLAEYARRRSELRVQAPPIPEAPSPKPFASRF